MASQVSSASSSLVAFVVIFLTCATALPATPEDKSIDDPHPLTSQLLQQARPTDHAMTRRKVSLSHKYVGLGRRSSFDAEGGDLVDDNRAALMMPEPDRRVLSSVQLSGNDEDDYEEKRALPSNLRYTGIGKRGRQSGVSSGMRYTGLGKRMASETGFFGTDDDEVDPKQTVATNQAVNRRRRFAVDDMLDDDDETASDFYVIKRQPGVSAMPGRQRIGAGMRYVGVGKRKLIPSLRSRVDAGMRYIGIGK